MYTQEYRSPEYIPGYGDASSISPRMHYTQKMRNYLDQTSPGEDSGLQALAQMLEQLEAVQGGQQTQQQDFQPGIGNFLSELGGMYKEGIGDILRWRSSQGPDVTQSPLSSENVDALMPYFMGSTGPSTSIRSAAGSAAESFAPIISKLKDAGGYIGGKVKGYMEPVQEATQMYERVPSNYTLREVWDTLIGQGGDDVAGLAAKSGRPKKGGYAESIARYLEPTDEAMMRDLALLFRKQPGKAWELVHGEPNLFEMGVKGPAETSGLSRQYSIMEPLGNLYDKAAQGVGETASQVVNSLADMFPTAGRNMAPGLAHLVERGGRVGADALSSATDAMKRAGIVNESAPNWYAKTKGQTRKRYVASGPKQAGEGADLWQRDVLKNVYRDIKPTYQDRYAPVVEDWLPVLKALAPLGLGPAIAPKEMWGDAARLVGLGSDTVSNKDNPGLIESIAYLLGR